MGGVTVIIAVDVVRIVSVDLDEGAVGETHVVFTGGTSQLQQLVEVVLP